MADPVSVVCLARPGVEAELRQALAIAGVDIEFPPGFAFISWTGGMLLARVRYLPTCALPLDGLVAPDVPGPRGWHWSGFELDILRLDDQHHLVQFTTRLGDPLTMHLLKLLCAASLTELTRGELGDERGDEITRRPLAWALQRATDDIAWFARHRQRHSYAFTPAEPWSEHEARKGAFDPFSEDIPGCDEDDAPGVDDGDGLPGVEDEDDIFASMATEPATSSSVAPMIAGCITIQFHAGDLENPDLDLRHAIPDELVRLFPDLLVDEGYDHAWADDLMNIFLGTHDIEEAAKRVVRWVAKAVVKGNRLARFAYVLATDDRGERQIFPPMS